MVTMKIDSTGVDVNKSNGFEPYEGPLPTPGVYAATIASCKIRISQAGNPYFNVLFEFANQTKADKQQFKGYPLWEKIVPGESDIQKERVGKFVHAVCGKVKANVDHDEVTDGGKVNKIGGKDPVGTRVRIVVSRSTYNGEPIVEMRDLFGWPKDQEWPDGEIDSDDEVEEVDEEEDDLEEEEEDDEFEARSAELEEMDRTALKAALKAAGFSGSLKKSDTDEQIREMILELEFPVDEADEDDEDEDDEEDPF